MIGKSRSVAGLERELRQKRTQLEEAERNGLSEDRLAAVAGDDKLDQAAADLLADRIDEAGYTRVEADVSKARAAHAANADRHRRVHALLADEIAGLEHELADRPFDSAIAKLVELNKEHEAAATAFAKSLRTVVAAGARLAKTRDALDEQLAQAKELRPEWRDLDVDLVDEDEWPVVKELVALLKAGRRDGAAREKERVRRRDEDEKNAAARRVPNMVNTILRPNGTTAGQIRERFDSLSEDEQAEALRRVEASFDRLEQEVRARYTRPNSLFGPQSFEADREVEKVRAACEARIGWLRDGKTGPDPMYATTPGPPIRRDLEPVGLIDGGRL